MANPPKERATNRAAAAAPPQADPGPPPGTAVATAPPAEDAVLAKGGPGRDAQPGDESSPAVRNLGAPPKKRADKLAGPAAQPEPDVIAVEVRVCRGSLTRVKTPVAVIGRYERIPLAGPAKEYDQLLDGWLSRAVDLGMIGSEVGEVFPVPLQRWQNAGPAFLAENLLFVGMGEPGHFGIDDLAFLFSNVTVAAKAMAHNEFATTLIGTRRNELSVSRAVRGLLQGVVDGYARFRAALEGVTVGRDQLDQLAHSGMTIVLMEVEESRVKEILDALAQLARQQSIIGLELHSSEGEKLPAPEGAVAEPSDLPPENERMNLLQISRTEAPAAQAGPAQGRTDTFEFSALGETSAVPVREVRLNSYFTRQLQTRFAETASVEDQTNFGIFFKDYLFPEEFRHFIEGDAQLTLVLDATTACFPWEMAAYRGHGGTRFFGTNLRLTRQFRSLQSATPGVPPPLNHTLRVLLIADPAPPPLSLPGTRTEALAVIAAMKAAKQVWGNDLDLRVTVRIGPPAAPDTAGLLQDLALETGVVESAQPCDPMELVMLLVKEEYDVVHFAGHGVFDRAGGRMGWVFNDDCVLSAEEIFRVRKVPRLVFANACLSAVTASLTDAEHRRHQVSLAQAFFARGIQNYIGTGWEVNDELAATFAKCFYAQVLSQDTAPPATIGHSLAAAREAVRTANSSTWGAYQHYGRANDKLLPVPNTAPDAE